MDDLKRLHEDASTAERLGIVGEFKIAEVLCAPGHRSLRIPEAVQSIARKIASADLEQVLAEPILLGIFTDEGPSEVRLRAIECLDGNHRLLAGLLSGVWRQIKDIPIHGLDARVNGWPAHGTGPENRWLPLDVVRASQLASTQWSEVPESAGAKGPTAQVPGWICGRDPVIAEKDRSISFGELLKEWKKRR